MLVRMWVEDNFINILMVRITAAQLLWKSGWRFLPRLNIALMCGQAQQFLVFSPEMPEQHTAEKNRIPMFIAGLFTTAKL